MDFAAFGPGSCRALDLSARGIVVSTAQFILRSRIVRQGQHIEETKLAGQGRKRSVAHGSFPRPHGDAWPAAE